MASIKNLYQRSRHILVYATFMAAMILLLKWLQWKYLIADYSVEIYVGLIAVAFTGLGLWLATRLTDVRTRTIVVEKKIYLPPQTDHAVNEEELNKLALTNREYDVLKLLVKGNSNAEIADQLCLSLSTIKTHVSNVLVKMNVRSRVQVIEKANRLKLTP